MINPPSSGIWYWFFNAGLTGIKWEDINLKNLPERYDTRLNNGALYQNYLAGINASLQASAGLERVPAKCLQPLHHYPMQSWGAREDRFVPCKGTKCLCKWSQVSYKEEAARAFFSADGIAENLKGSNIVVIDIDGDHNEVLNWDAIKFGYSLAEKSGTQMRISGRCSEEYDVSFHIVFKTLRIIPTYHFPDKGIDICGNKNNQLVFHKNKKFIGVPKLLTHAYWNEILEYIRR